MGGEARQGLVLPAPRPGASEQAEHRHEFAYLHVLLMVALAINEEYQRWCRETLGETIQDLQTPDIKSYSRMRNKMFSADDHRFRPAPRPESNVDINRVLAVAKDPASMVAAGQALSDACGGVAKQKNGFSLSSEAAAPQYHLRLIMISVVFEMPAARNADRAITFGELAADPRVVELWDEYARREPQAGEPGCEWDADVAAAREFLCSEEVAANPVRMITEVQMVLPFTAEVRHEMHELYKVARADTDKQLYLDFKPIADKENRARQAESDGKTALRRACRDGDCDSVQRLLRDGGIADDELDQAFMVACTHGCVPVIRMHEMEKPARRVGWKTVSHTISETARPSVQVLDVLMEKYLNLGDLRLQSVPAVTGQSRARCADGDADRSSDEQAVAGDQPRKATNYDSDSNKLHVRGLCPELESSDALSQLFSQFGQFLGAAVRRRGGSGGDSGGVAVGHNEESDLRSWAMVTMGDAASYQRALRGPVVYTSPSGEQTRLQVSAFSRQQAAESTGAMVASNLLHEAYARFSIAHDSHDRGSEQHVVAVVKMQWRMAIVMATDVCCRGAFVLQGSLWPR
eukprot:SAG25_NODE_990_length_4387_cov_3.395989_4_plen_577_part_00